MSRKPLKPFCGKILELREAKGWSQYKLAQIAGTTPQQISHLENGRRQFTYEWMERLARAFECEITDLMSDGLLHFRFDTANRAELAEEEQSGSNSELSGVEHINYRMDALKLADDSLRSRNLASLSLPTTQEIMERAAAFYQFMVNGHGK